MAISPAFRILGAFVILLIFLQALYVSRNVMIHQRPQSPEVAAADHTSLTSLDSGHHNSNAPGPGFSITNIPDKVWHKANEYNITDQRREWISTWVKTNPSCRQELFSDGSSHAFVRSRYGHTRPDIVEVYEALEPLDSVIVGDVETCRRKMTKYAEAGVDRLMCLMQYGQLAHEDVMSSMRLVGEALIPEFATATAS